MSDEPLVYDGWLKVVHRKVGKRTYDILLSPSAVAAWVVTAEPERQVVLVRQYRPSVQRETWEIPAGVLDKTGLGPREVLQEELLEETGLHILPERMDEMLSYIPQIGYNDSRLTIYGVTLQDTPLLPPLEDKDVVEARWFPLERIDQLILSGDICDEKTILAHYCYQVRSKG